MRFNEKCTVKKFESLSEKNTTTVKLVIFLFVFDIFETTQNKNIKDKLCFQNFDIPYI